MALKAPPLTLCIHWKVGAGVPVAATEKVAIAGAVTVELTGWAVKLGATGAGLTVKVAILLVTLPEALVMTHSNSVPLLAVVVAAVV